MKKLFAKFKRYLIKFIKKEVLIFIITTSALLPFGAAAQTSFEIQEGYPIEVMGASTTIKAGPMPTGTPGSLLYFKIHSVSYPQELLYDQPKVSIRVSGGSWVDVSNDNAICPGSELVYECVEGPLATVRFALRVSKLGDISQADSIYYRFNFIAGDASSGFRVLAASKTIFDELAVSIISPADTTDTVDSTDVVIDPPPVDEVLLTGEELFRLTNHLVDFPGGPVIKAGCADCHAVDGRDLKYFGFSRNSIVKRSEFHGLSTEEGIRIADYIHERDLIAAGTPWDPPYQPGFTIDTLDVYKWAAGAGLEAVLEHDSLYMLPIEDINLDGIINRQIIPTAIQFPDWNEWLPVRHPAEDWNGNFWESDSYLKYAEIKLNFETPGYIDEAIRNGRILRLFDSWADAVKDAERSDETFVGFSTEERAKRDLSLYQWQLIKTWELMHTYDLEGRSPELYDHGAALSWFSRSRMPFNLGPHIHGSSKGPNYTIYNTYFDTSWYQLAFTINTGNSTTLGLKPITRRYHYNHIRDMGSVNGAPTPQRFLISYLEAIQTGAKIGPQGIVQPAFWINTIGPLHQEGCGKNPFCQMSLKDRQRYANAFLGEFVAFLERYPVSVWDGVIEASEEIPICDGAMYFEKNTAHATFCLVKEWDGFADPALIDRLAAWGAERWPGGEW